MAWPRIKTLQVTGNLDFRRLDPQRYDENADGLGNIEIPPLDLWHEYGNINELNLLLKTLTLSINLYDKRTFIITWKPGFITDFASVPKFFRGIIDNDDLDLMIAAMLHDWCTVYHPFGNDIQAVKYTNKLFEAVVAFKGHEFKAFLAELAVDSIYGHAVYFSKRTEKRRNAEKYVEFIEIPRHGDRKKVKSKRRTHGRSHINGLEPNGFRLRRSNAGD